YPVEKNRSDRSPREDAQSLALTALLILHDQRNGLARWRRTPALLHGRADPLDRYLESAVECDLSFANVEGRQPGSSDRDGPQPEQIHDRVGEKRCRKTSAR